MDEPWIIPTGQMESIASDLNIDIMAEPEISTSLASVNGEMRKKGIIVLDGAHQFRIFFSAITHYQSASEAICDQLWDVMNRGFRVQGSKALDNLNQANRIAFLLCKTMDETMRKSRTKKNECSMMETRFDQWAKHLKFLLRQIDAHRATLPDDFAQLILGLCWEVFRSVKKNKTIRSEVAVLIGVLAPSCGSDEIAINLVKLVQKDESLGDYFAECIDEWTKQEKCRGILKAVILEMINLSDTNAQKGLVNLVQGLARRAPMVLSREMTMLEELIATSDVKYWAREAGLAAIAEIYAHLERHGDPEQIDKEQMAMDMSGIQDGDDEEELNMKEKCFRKLTQHIYDRNSFARSYTLHLFKRLATEVRLPHMGHYLERIVSRFDDNAALVRRAAVQCFVAMLNQSQILEQLQSIDQLREQVKQLSENDPENVHLNALRVILRDTEKLLELVKKGSEYALRLLKSNCIGDTVEAIKWFYQITVLKIYGADMGGFRSMAVYVYSKEDSIKNEVLKTYKDIYLNDRRESRVTALGLIMLIKDCSEAEASSIAKLIELIGIPGGAKDEIWRFALGDEKLDERQRAAAVVLIRFMSKNTMNEANIELLTDLINDKTAGPLVLSEICATLMLIRPSKELMKSGSLTQDNAIFVNLQRRILQCSKQPSVQLANLVMRAIKLYFHISANPTELASNILFNLFRVSNKLMSNQQLCRDSLVVTFAAAGQTALHLAVFVECTVIPRMTANMNKKAKVKKGKKTNKEDDDEEMDEIFGNVDNLDEARDMYLSLLEQELSRGPFVAIVNLLTKIMTKADKFPLQVVNAAAGAMSKFMVTSATLAEEKASLFFTLLERSNEESVVSTLLAAFPDLLVRHPNTMEPWTRHVLTKLHDSNDTIKKNCLNMVTELIVKGLIKPRGRLADIALLTLDENQEIQSLARSFFVQFGAEGNHLLNQLPDILANLHQDDLVESDFRQISEFLFEQFTSKEKQMELMVSNLCARFKEDDPQVWSQVALTISVMTPSEKALKKLIENSHYYKDKLENLEIRDRLMMMPMKARENTKLFNKAKETIEELELVIRGEKTVPSPKKKLTQSQQANQVKEVKSRTTRGGARKTRRAVWSSDEEDDDAENAPPPAAEVTPARRSRRQK